MIPILCKVLQFWKYKAIYHGEKGKGTTEENAVLAVVTRKWYAQQMQLIKKEQAQ